MIFLTPEEKSRLDQRRQAALARKNSASGFAQPRAIVVFGDDGVGMNADDRGQLTLALTNWIPIERDDYSFVDVVGVAGSTVFDWLATAGQELPEGVPSRWQPQQDDSLTTEQASYADVLWLASHNANVYWINLGTNDARLIASSTFQRQFGSSDMEYLAERWANAARALILKLPPDATVIWSFGSGRLPEPWHTVRSSLQQALNEAISANPETERRVHVIASGPDENTTWPTVAQYIRWLGDKDWLRTILPSMRKRLLRGTGIAVTTGGIMLGLYGLYKVAEGAKKTQPRR